MSDKANNPFAGMDTVNLLANGLLLALTSRGKARATVMEMCALLAERMTGEELARAVKQASRAVEAAAVRDVSLFQKVGEA